MSAARIGLVAWHVFKESVRDRVLYAIGGFAVLLVAASILIGQITAGEDVKIIKDLGLAVIELAGLLMAMLVGVGLVAKEIERKSIFSLLSKPLPRWEFIVGKYVGLVLTLLVNVAMMTAALYAMLGYYHLAATPVDRAAWEAPALDPMLLVAVLMVSLELAVLTAVALFFSTFSSSTLLSILFTAGILITGLYSDDLRHFGDIVEVPRSAALFVGGLGWVVPAFSAFDVKAQVVHGLVVPAGFVGFTVVYALAYIAAALGGAIALFSRREFK
jgi:ABC-type transport system involved in multi-copper enzyme maturation permease subunit